MAPTPGASNGRKPIVAPVATASERATTALRGTALRGGIGDIRDEVVRVMSGYSRRQACRACGAPLADPFLSLGPMPLANNLARTAEALATQSQYPLDLCVCERCSLVQTPDVVDPTELFAHYVYLTGMSETMAASLR